MALADTAEHLRAISGVYDELRQAKANIELELAEARREEVRPRDVEVEIKAALAALNRLDELAADPDNLGAVGKLFQTLNVNLFLNFESRQVGKRKLNKLAGGVLTMGDVDFPIEPYKGKTARREVKGTETARVARSTRTGGTTERKPPSKTKNGRRADSLGNVGRGERI
jgi:hypothetical protein